MKTKTKPIKLRKLSEQTNSTQRLSRTYNRNTTNSKFLTFPPLNIRHLKQHFEISERGNTGMNKVGGSNLVNTKKPTNRLILHHYL